MSIGVHFDDDAEEDEDDEDVNVFSHWDEDWSSTEDTKSDKDENKKD
jgi:hypothetical protein